MTDQRATYTRRGFIGFSMAAGAGTALAGCGGGAGGGSGSAASGSVSALFMKQAGYSASDVRGMTDDFEKAKSKINVKPTFVAYEALHDKIVAAAPAGTYDVVLIDVIWPAEFGAKHLVEDVTKRFPASWNHEILGGALKTARYKSRYYGVPWILDTKYFFYNTAMLKKAGASEKQLGTWDGVLEAARAVKRKGITKYPLIWSWSQAEALICDYTQLLGAFGGSFFDGAGKPAFNTGGGRKALEFMVSTLHEGLSNPNSVESLEDDVLKTFSQGSAAFNLNWTFQWAGANDPKQSHVDGDVGVLTTPRGPGGDNPGCNGSMALSISSGSQNKDAAWSYIKSLTSKKEQDTYAKHSLPIWKSSYDSPEVEKTSPEMVKVAKKQLNNMILRPQVPAYNEFSKELQVELQNALLGRKSPGKALDDAAAKGKEILSGS
ncbi:MAG: extracellular solute-binding protein [Streptosporangiaceae bacterium]